jgi:acyl-CoA synthetase (AMP-forming)/AMP-acid ligase II
MMEQKYTQKEQEYRSRLNKAMKEFVKRKIYSLGYLIENLSIEKPNKPALFFEDVSYSWREFNNECNAYANFFHNLGLEHRNGIAIILENCPEYLFITMGLNKIQGFTALINTNQRKDALIHAISIADPKYIIIDGKHVPNLSEIHESLSIDKDRIFVINNPEKVPHEFTEIEDDIKSSSRENPPTTKNSTPNDYIFSIYTSGTTGLPKAVNNRNGIAPAGIYTVSICQLNSEDISYIITPLYHGLAMSLVWTGVVYSGASALLKRKFSSSNFWKDIHKHKVSFLALIGEIPRYLLNQPVSPLEKDHTLKKILSVGLKKMIWMKFKERFQIEHIFEVYT